LVGLLLAGCAETTAVNDSHGRRSAKPHVSRPGSPSPARTVVKNAHTYPAGRGVDFAAQRGVSLHLMAGEPDTSRTRLSSSYGYPPARGWYVTFRLVVTNTGSRSILVSPHDFFVRPPSGLHVTSYDGNAPYSGAPRQLDTTQLEPGQRVAAPLTFDVAKPHGRLAYAPDGSTAIAWTF
jgi:hypothetical protein